MDTPELGHAYSYYNPYYYYDHYYGYGYGGDALGFVLFFIFLLAILFCLFWGWGDDEGCSTPGYNKKKVVHKHVYKQVANSPPPLAPKPTAPPAQITIKERPVAKLRIPVKPYKAFQKKPKGPPRPVTLNTPTTYWSEDQLKLIGSVNTESFFKLLQREIINKLKARRNPRELAAQLIVVRKQLNPEKSDIVLLERYIKMGIFNVQAADIKVLSSPSLRLLAIDIIARLSGFPKGYIDLPEKIMYWVTDFVSI